MKGNNPLTMPPPAGLAGWHGPNVTDQQYHDIPMLGGSSLARAATQSLAAFWRAWDEPTLVTPAMHLGTYVHARLLEPERDLQVIEIEVPDQRTTKGKESLQAALGAVDRDGFLQWRRGNGPSPFAANVLCLTPDERRDADDLVCKVQELALTNETLDAALAGVRECEISLTGSAWEWWVKGKVDGLGAIGPNNRLMLLDVKTCLDCSPRGITRAIAQWGYHVQLALYERLVVEQAREDGAPAWLADCDLDDTLWVVLALQKATPSQGPDVAVYALEPGWRLIGQQVAVETLGRLERSFEDDYWPGVMGNPGWNADLPVPKWLEKATWERMLDDE